MALRQFFAGYLFLSLVQAVSAGPPGSLDGLVQLLLLRFRVNALVLLVGALPQSTLQLLFSSDSKSLSLS